VRSAAGAAQAATAAKPERSGSTPVHYILGTRVDPSTYPEATELIASWARRAESRYVCVANVHMIMEAHDDPSFREVVNGADFVTSDGMPLVWGLRLQGARSARRVYGPDLTPLLCAIAARDAIPVGFFGADPGVRDAMIGKLLERYPGLQVVYAESPPYRDLTVDEDAAFADAINASGARILFVGLGCPKQERWMVRNVGRVDAVMLGVGAAFDFLAGTKPKAPPILQRLGLEWLFRLASEPRRLWRRYAYHNPRFVWLVCRDLMRGLRGHASGT
jgi:N-acetylglucosaminyldiphosphoundecaprenol N-acetyl-beta-D-mannosaminyltransferase